MAIAYLGFSQASAEAGNGSVSTITIPSGATVGIVMCIHWDSTVSNDLATVTLDSQSVSVYQTRAIGVGGSGSAACWLGSVTGFSTGASKTLSWTWDSDQTISEGGQIYVTYWSGVDLTTPIGASDMDAQTTSTAVQCTVGTDAGDVVVVESEKFDSGTNHEMSADGSPSITSVVNDDINNSHRVDLDYFSRTQATHIVDMDQENYSSMIAAVLQASSVGSTDINYTGTGRGILRGLARGVG